MGHRARVTLTCAVLVCGCQRPFAKLQLLNTAPAQPSILTLSPNAGFRPQVGFAATLVEVRGTHIEGAQILFTGDTTPSVTTCPPANTELERVCAEVSTTATSGPVRVVVGEETLLAPGQLEILGAPLIHEVAPNEGFGALLKNPALPSAVSACDYTLTLGESPACLRVLEVRGDNFDADRADNNHVFIGDVAVPIIPSLGLSRTRFYVQLPSGVSTGNIRVDTPAGSASSLAPMAPPAAPLLAGVSPLTTFYNQFVILRGTGFDRTTFGNNVVTLELAGGSARRAVPFAITDTTVSFLMPEFAASEIPPGTSAVASLRIVTPAGEDVLQNALSIVGPPALDAIVVDNSRLDELVGLPPAALQPSTALVARGATLSLGKSSTGASYLVNGYQGSTCPDSQPPRLEKLGSRIVFCGRNFDQAQNMRVSLGDEVVTLSALDAQSSLCAAGSVGVSFFLPPAASSTHLRLTTLSGVIDEDLSGVEFWPAVSVERVQPRRAVADQVVTLFGKNFIDHPKAQAVVVRSGTTELCASVLYVRNHTEMAVRLPEGAPAGGELVIKHSAGETVVPEFRMAAGSGQLANDSALLSSWVSRSAVGTPSPGLASVGDAEVAGVTAGEEEGVPLAFQNKFVELYDATFSADLRTAWASQRGPSSITASGEQNSLCVDGASPHRANLVTLDVLRRTSAAFGAPLLCGADLHLALSDDGSVLAAFRKKLATWPRSGAAGVVHQVYFFDALTGAAFGRAELDLEPDATPASFVDGGVQSQVLHASSTDGATWLFYARTYDPMSAIYTQRIYQADAIANGPSTQVAVPCSTPTGPIVREVTGFGVLLYGVMPPSCSLLVTPAVATAPQVMTLGIDVYALTPSGLLQGGMPPSEWTLPSGPSQPVGVTGFRQDPPGIAGVLQHGTTLFRTYDSTAAGGAAEASATGVRRVDMSEYPILMTSEDRMLGAVTARVRNNFNMTGGPSTTHFPRRAQPLTDAQGRLWLTQKIDHTDGTMEHEKNAEVVLTQTLGSSALVTFAPALENSEKPQAVAFDDLGELYVGTSDGRVFHRQDAAALAVAALSDPVVALAPWPGQRGTLVFQRSGDDTIVRWLRADASASDPTVLWTCNPSPCQTTGPLFPAASFVYVPQWDGFLMRSQTNGEDFALVTIADDELVWRRYTIATLGTTPRTLTSISMLGDRPGIFVSFTHMDGVLDYGFFAALPDSPPADESAWPAQAWSDFENVSEATARMQQPPVDSAASTSAPRFAGTQAYSVMNGRALLARAGAYFLRPHDYGFERSRWRSKPAIASMGSSPGMTQCIFGAHLLHLEGSRPFAFGCLPADAFALSDTVYPSPSGRRAYLFALERVLQPDPGPPPQQPSYCVHSLALEQGQLMLFNAGYCGGALGIGDPLLYKRPAATGDCSTHKSECRPEPWAAAMSPLGDTFGFATDDGRVVLLR